MNATIKYQLSIARGNANDSYSFKVAKDLVTSEYYKNHSQRSLSFVNGYLHALMDNNLIDNETMMAINDEMHAIDCILRKK